MITIDIPVVLDNLKCCSDHTLTRFYVARNPDDSTIFGKPGRTLHIIPHKDFHDTVDAYMHEHFDILPVVTGMPRTGSRLTMMYVLNAETAQIKGKTYHPCVFAVNTYDGSSPCVFVHGIWKNERQYSGSPLMCRIKYKAHTPACTTGVGREALIVLTPESAHTAFETILATLEHRTDVKDFSCEDLFKYLQYGHIMLNKSQRTALQDLWVKVPRPITSLNMWNAVTHTLNMAAYDPESCLRFGRLFLKVQRG